MWVICKRYSLKGIGFRFNPIYKFNVLHKDGSYLIYTYNGVVYECTLQESKYGQWFLFKGLRYYVEKGCNKMTKTRFKVECEIEVEYNVPEGITTIPYTHIAGNCENGIASIYTKEGKIIYIKMKMLERLN